VSNNFRILQENYRDKKTIWEIFSLSTFKGAKSTIMLDPKEIRIMLDKFKFNEVVPEVELISDLTHFIYQNLGGDKDTPAQEVLAFAYVLYASPNFRFADILKGMTKAIHVETTMSYITENDLSIPFQYLDGAAKLINDQNVWDTIMALYPDVPINNDMTENEYQSWGTDVAYDIEAYIKGVNATKSAFDKLI
jgi:hypothetical protein